MKVFWLLITSCLCVFLLASTSLAAVGEASSDAAMISAGISLYEEHCARCHRPFARTTKPQRPVNRLRSAISQFPVMHSLNSLNDEQFKALTTALVTLSL